MLDSLDPVLLARIQFAFTVSFHIIFPAFTIGLASYLAVLEGLWLATGREVFIRLYRYWIRIFAVAFGMGVVSGIVMSYEFGTNWSVFADKTGPILGPLMGYEVMTAFFLEAGFLGIMLFGMKKVGRGLHFAATVIVAAGTLFSAFWILAANSWMHTPTGHAVNEAGQYVADDWIDIIFNPSFPYRLVHMVLAAYLTTALVVGAVGAWHVLRAKLQSQDSNEAARTMLSMALWMAAVVAPVQIVAGDMHGLNTLEHQPAKIAAMEGHFETQAPAGLILFGWPDMEAEETLWAVEIPHLGSLILTHTWDGAIRGLKEFPREDWPNATIVFWSFRVMVGLGFLMAALGLVSLWLRWRRRLFDRRWFLRWSVAMGPAGFVAVLAGWITTEVGRQPWVVYGQLRTADAASPIGAPGIAGSLLAFVVVYLLIFGAGTVYLLRQMAQPPAAEAEPTREEAGRTAGIAPTRTLERRDA